MSKYQDIDMLVDEMYGNLRRLADRTLQAMNDETSRAMEDAYREFGIYQQQRITEEFQEAVQQFYDAYKPTGGYARTYGLYDVLNLEGNVDEFGMVSTGSGALGYRSLFDESRLHTDRAGGSLFDKVFMEGWHGGAEGISSSKAQVWGEHPGPGTPYYRRGGFVKYPGEKKKKWHKYGKWGKVAKRTTAPYKIFATSMGVIEPNEFFEKFKEISKRHNDEAIERVKRDIPRFEAEIYG